MTPELLSKIAGWRAKEAAGTLTIDDMKLAIAAMREGRLNAAAASDGAKRKKARAVIKSADQLLDELSSMGGKL